MVRRRRAFGDVLVSAAALVVLLLALVAVDDRVREQVALRVGTARPATELARAGASVRDLGSVVFEAARDQSIEHAPLVIFVLVATVLVVVMLRV